MRPSLLQNHPQRYFRLRCAIFAGFSLTAFFLSVMPQPAWAQEALFGTRVAPEGAARNLLDLLQKLDYDTTQYVPLLVVNPGRWIVPSSPLPERLTSIAILAEAAQLRVVSPGRLNALVPRTMLRINNHPGTANPFEGVSGGDALKLLTGTLTPAQWKIIGSADGIGVGDLAPDQRLLWARIIDGPVSIQTSTVEAGDSPGSVKYTNTTLTQMKDVSLIHIRISKRVQFGFSSKGSDDQRYVGDPYHIGGGAQAGETIHLVRVLSPRDAADARKLYGQPLLLDDANLEKPGDVDYASASLDPRISLHFPPKEASKPAPAAPKTVGGRTTVPDFGVNALPTVTDVIARINDTTHLHFVADRRVRDLPVYLRGDSARSGDLLQAFARSVCGTFRKIPASAPGEPTLYLLTCDREGIGAQVARLATWGEKAEDAKRALEDKTSAQVAKAHPLSYLSFAPDDSFALNAAQTDAIESRWSKEEYAAAPEVKWEDMSPKLQQGIRDYEQSVVSLGWNLRTDRVRISEQLATYLVVPGVGAVVEDSLGYGIGNQYIEKIAFDPSLAPPRPAKPAAPAAQTDPVGFPATVKRRLLVAAPASEAEATALAQAAAGHGFTDLDLQVSLGNPVASAHLLESAVKAGAASHLTVGATVSLLHKNGIDGGEPERNILGQTGAEFGDTLLKQYVAQPATSAQWLPYFQRMVARYDGWTVAQPADLTAHLAPIAAVPGLGSLTLRATAAPGWAGNKQSDGIQFNGALGHSLSTRRAFLLDYGIDPIDIPDQPWPVRQIKWDLGYFAESDAGGEYLFVNGKMIPRPAAEVPRLAWWNFRVEQNKALLAALYQSVRIAHPTLPLYLDDRASSYVDVNAAWFGSWDAPDRLPDYPVYYAASAIHDAARAASKTLFALWGESWLPRVGTKDDTPAYFASRLTIVAKANQPPQWDGLAVDLSGLPVKDVLRLLSGLPLANQ